MQCILGAGVGATIGLAALLGLSATRPHDPVFQRKTEMLNTVVQIETSTGWGSGTIIHSGDDGVYVLTNHHVMPAKDVTDQSLKLRAWIYDTASEPAMPIEEDAEIVADDEAKDLTLLRVIDPEWRARYVAAVIDAHDPVEQTETVYVVGAGLHNRVYATEGMVSLTYVPRHDKDGPQVEMISAPTIMGNSGGAAFVERGGRYVLAGVPEALEIAATGAGPTVVPHMAFAITMREVRDFLLRNGKAGLLKRRG